MTEAASRDEACVERSRAVRVMDVDAETYVDVDTGVLVLVGIRVSLGGDCTVVLGSVLDICGIIFRE